MGSRTRGITKAMNQKLHTHLFSLFCFWTMLLERKEDLGVQAAILKAPTFVVLVVIINHFCVFIDFVLSIASTTVFVFIFHDLI